MDGILKNINKKDISYICILVIVTGILYFFALGDMALTDPDETFYAQTAKEMLNKGEWITPFIFDQPQFEKPIFYYWTIIAGYKIFGVSEFAARFFSAIFGILGVIGTYFLGRFLFSKLCGFLSGLVLATCVQYFVLSRACVTDMALAVSILYCLLFLIVGLDNGLKRYYICAAIMAGLAVLTKGPIGLFIPGVVYILYITFSRQWGKIRSVPFFSCIAVFLLVAAPWYLIVTKIHGPSFINEFFGFQNITRFLEPEHRTGSSPLFYIPIIMAGLFPWSLFLPLGIVGAFKKGISPGIKRYGKFLLIWFLVVFIFFSISRTKLVTYIFPLYPAMAIFVGRIWEQFINGFEGDKKYIKAMKWTYGIFMVLSFIAIIAVPVFVKMEYPEAFHGTVVTMIVFAVGILISLAALLRNKRQISFYSIVMLVMAILLPLNSFILPEIEQYESRKELSLLLKSLAKPTEAIGGECDNRRGIAYYTDNPNIEDINNFGDMRDFFMRKDRVWGIIKQKHYRTLVKEYPEIVSKPFARVGKMVLVKNNI